ncbi:hypothetical protein JCM33374_g3316 [Metschnikowia sp. JCM 33374]|nr:hypothetical protein JCM33374_g3316 [Metschnikowia sp. JCM 33374]
MLLLLPLYIISVHASESPNSGLKAASFVNLSPQQILQEANTIVFDNKAFNEKIAAINEPSVHNVLIPTINHENENFWKSDMLKFYRHVSPNKEVRDASTEAEILLNTAKIEQDSRKDLFHVYNKLWEQIKNNPHATDEESLKVLETIVNGFKRNGLDFPPEKQQEIQALQIELTNLSTTFLKNINEEKGYICFTKDELDGVPDSLIQNFDVIQENGGSKYKVTFKETDILPVLQYANNQDTRKAAHLANMNKTPQNVPILDKIIRIRFKLAKLLGYRTYSEFVLQKNIARNQENVMTFLNDLRSKLHSLAHAEVSKMLDFKNKHLAANGLAPQQRFYAWDDTFYSNLLLEKEYQVDHQKISEYFPIQQTIRKMLSFYETLFDVKFVRKQPSNVWHNDIQKYAVYQNVRFGDPKAKFMGWVLFDLHPREGKFTHAAVFDLHRAFVKSDGTRAPSYTVVVCNFTKRTKKAPSLLEQWEVTTLFHEMGHAVHNLLSQTKHARFQGTNVPMDFVECPSQMLEFWTWSRTELKNLSGHYLTGNPIPDELIDQVITSKYMNLALSNFRQLIYSFFDMALHTIETDDQLEALDIKALWNNMFEESALISNESYENIGYTSFAHIVWDYESGYYGYLYSKVFAADIYYTIFKADPMNVENGLRYRDVILKNGGAKDIPDILTELLGRPPNADAFLAEALGSKD